MKCIICDKPVDLNCQWSSCKPANENNRKKEYIMKRDQIVKKLKTGEVIVTFTKKDGTERVMKCTLKEDLVPSSELESKGRKPNLEILSVWDLEKDAWRSFRLDSIKTVEV